MTTYWEREYERTNQEILNSLAEVALKGRQRSWPAAGLNVPTAWNPNGYPLLEGRNDKTVTQSTP